MKYGVQFSGHGSDFLPRQPVFNYESWEDANKRPILSDLRELS